jgi:hypothetical protein
MCDLLQKRGFNDPGTGQDITLLNLPKIYKTLHKYYPILTFESGEQVI